MTWMTQVYGWVQEATLRIASTSSSPAGPTWIIAAVQCPRTTTQMANARRRSTTRLRVSGVASAIRATSPMTMRATYSAPSVRNAEAGDLRHRPWWEDRVRQHHDRSEGEPMPIATPEVYADMLDRAKNGSFAYPAINITSSQTVTAAIRGFAEAGSDGIIQVSTGGGEYASGSTVKNMVTGALALAAYAEEVAKGYPVNIALHTDHCPEDKLDGFVRPLIAASTERVKAGG